MAHPHGLIGWVDLTTNDVDAAKAFYGQLFGWEGTDIPTPMGPTYTIMRKDGLMAAGVGPLPPDLVAAGVPSTWTSYVIVDDLDAVLALVAPAGGRVVMPAMDVMTEGRMAQVADPTGAVIGLWQPRDHGGAEVFNVPGTLTWNELQTRDLAGATAFYATVFGWRWAEMGAGSGYLVGHLDAKDGDDTSNCGAMTTPPMVPAEAPNCWMVYFAVADCDAAVARAVELGATVFLPAMQMGPGRFAGLLDPSGAAFLVSAFAASA